MHRDIIIYSVVILGDIFGLYVLIFYDLKDAEN